MQRSCRSKLAGGSDAHPVTQVSLRHATKPHSRMHRRYVVGNGSMLPINVMVKTILLRHVQETSGEVGMMASGNAILTVGYPIRGCTLWRHASSRPEVQAPKGFAAFICVNLQFCVRTCTGSRRFCGVLSKKAFGCHGLKSWFSVCTGCKAAFPFQPTVSMHFADHFAILWRSLGTRRRFV